MRYEEQIRSAMVALFDAYSAHVGLQASTLSRLLFNDPHLYIRLSGGKVSFRIRTFDIVVARFSSVWPDDLPWPDGIMRVDERTVPDMMPMHAGVLLARSPLNVEAAVEKFGIKIVSTPTPKKAAA